MAMTYGIYCVSWWRPSALINAASVCPSLVRTLLSSLSKTSRGIDCFRTSMILSFSWFNASNLLSYSVACSTRFASRDRIISLNRSYWLTLSLMSQKVTVCVVPLYVNVTLVPCPAGMTTGTPNKVKVIPVNVGGPGTTGQGVAAATTIESTPVIAAPF